MRMIARKKEKPHDGGESRLGPTITFLTAAFPGRPPFMLALQFDS